MLRLLKPRPLIIAAIVTFTAGIAVLYAGYPSLGPVGLLVGMLCAIMAAILIVTPQAAVEAAYARLATDSDSPVTDAAAADLDPTTEAAEPPAHHDAQPD